jgi:hypothetical protein
MLFCAEHPLHVSMMALVKRVHLPGLQLGPEAVRIERFDPITDFGVADDSVMGRYSPCVRLALEKIGARQPGHGPRFIPDPRIPGPGQKTTENFQVPGPMAP